MTLTLVLASAFVALFVGVLIGEVRQLRRKIASLENDLLFANRMINTLKSRLWKHEYLGNWEEHDKGDTDAH